MTIVDQLSGIIPTVVTAGAVMKITDNVFGNKGKGKKLNHRNKKNKNSVKHQFNNPF